MRSFLPKSLLGRLLLILSVPIIVIQLVSNFVFLDSHLDSVTRTASRNLVGMLDAIMHQEKDPEDFARKFFDIHYSVTPYEKLGTDQHHDISWAEKYLIDALEARTSVPFLVTHKGDFIIIKIMDARGVLTFKVLRKRLMSKMTQVVFYWTIGTSLLSLIVAAIVMRNQVRPIRDLTKAVNDFGNGVMGPELPLRGAQEVRQITKVFETTKQRIRRYIDQRTQMLSGISHDMQTPLMKIQMALLTMPAQEEPIKIIKNEANKLEKMLTDYLHFIKQENAEQKELVNVQELFLQLQKKYAGLDIRLTSSQDPFMILTRPLGFYKCLDILLKLIHKTATTCHISLSQEDSMSRLILDDDGLSIPGHLRQKIFRPFYQLEGKQIRHNANTGLGLSIVKDIFQGQGGDISIEDSPLKGSRFVLSLPH